MPEQTAWTVDGYETEQGERPALGFLQGLAGRNQSEAVALVKLLRERGNSLRRPQSGALGEGLFELRGRRRSGEQEDGGDGVDRRPAEGGSSAGP